MAHGHAKGSGKEIKIDVNSVHSFIKHKDAWHTVTRNVSLCTKILYPELQGNPITVKIILQQQQNSFKHRYYLICTCDAKHSKELVTAASPHE